MFTALAIAGSHAGWIVFVRLPTGARRPGRFKGDASTRIRLLAPIDPSPEQDGHRRRDTKSDTAPSATAASATRHRREGVRTPVIAFM
jgi:hypothetical protein